MRCSRRWSNMWSSHLSTKRTVVEAYEHLAHKGVIEHDDRQRRMAESCTPLLRFIEQSHAEEDAGKVTAFTRPWVAAERKTGQGWLQSISAVPSTVWEVLMKRAGQLFPDSVTRTLGFLEAENLGVVEKRGLYLCGDVGIGKTMILDLFGLCATPYPKRRSHLHSFMSELEHRLFCAEAELTARRRRVQLPAERKALRALRPMDVVVQEVLQETPILCFDEFQTFDVAHAALLAAFFTNAFRQGLFLLTTSNRRPEELCHVSSSFSAFLPVLHQYCNVVDCGDIRDYRLKDANECHHHQVFLHPNSRANMERLVRRIEHGYRTTNHHDRLDSNSAVEWIKEDMLWHHGRGVIVPVRCGGCAMFDFTDICGAREGFSSADMQLIASQFHTVVVTNVPHIGRGNYNASHQFIVLVDELYQNNVKLLFTSVVPWNHLLDPTYAARDARAIGDGADGNTLGGGKSNIRSSGSDGEYYSEGEDDRSGYMAHYNFHNEEEVVSFARIRSRLNEMGSASYLLRDHRQFVVSDFDFSAFVDPDIQRKVCS
ncbi:putative ATPase [Leptomonas pyrrhocoris]|uniref:Putative ATPase n=1 Tax=Leptomonas pyrrhocoris TaxID=157538 RepID=A0A0M9G465_LEPPY|nr:putative ATPase [Leptomonas pyrrhocoris]KPA81887.1 putative ATPase [Leptomonas pyrrhocoris]|eukprot:XP_015660326.1 putative ATPase [Leptomonas pyrrhocoris]